MVEQQQELKKQIYELKRIRRMVMFEGLKGYKVEQLDKNINSLRKKVVKENDISKRLSFGEYIDRRAHGETRLEIAEDFEVTVKELGEFVKKKANTQKVSNLIEKARTKIEEEKEMARVAKITIEQYKKYVDKGLTTKEIAKKVGISETAIYMYRTKWKKEGFLDVPVTTPVEKVTVVNPSELDRLTQINADLGSQHELLKAKNAELVEKNRLLTEKLNVIAKCDEKATEIQRLKQQLHDAKTAYEHASDRNVELNEQMDELEEQYNALKERYETLQGIASGYEHHEKELHEQADTLAIELENAHKEIAYLKNELQTERYKHTQDDSLQQRYNSLVTIAKPVLKEFVDSL